MGFGEDELITQRLRLIADNMLDMVSIINPEGIIEYISPSIINILGYEPERLVGHSFADIIHPQDLDSAITAFSTAAKATIQTREETRCRHADGHYVWLDSVVNPVMGDNGMVKAIVLASRDITARRHAEQYLQDERQKLYSLLDGLPSFLYLKNADYSIGYYNQKFRQLFGDPAGRPCFDVVNGFDQPCKNCPTFRVFETNSPEVWEWSSREDKTYQIYVYPFSDIDGTPLVLGLGIDITDRKRAEGELEYRIDFEKLITDISINFINIAQAEIDDSINYALCAIGEFAGVDRSYVFQFFNNQTRVECTHEWCADGIEPLMGSLKDLDVNNFPWSMDKLRRFEHIHIVRLADLPDEARAESELFQSLGIYSLVVLPMTYEKILVGFIGFVSVREEKTWPQEIMVLLKIVSGTLVNILERKKTENALRLSEERFSKAFRVSPCAMSIHRLADGKIIDVNNSFLSGLGYGREEVIGATSSKLKFWVESGNFSRIIAIINRNQGEISNYEIKFYTKSGEERLGLLSTEMIELNNEPCILMSINDITEIRHFEREMARLDRLNLIGQMAVGIGHEIRNPMTTVRGFLQLLSNKKGQSKYKEYYDLMIGELDRANSIITEYLFLAKNKAINLQPGNLNTIIEAMYPLISADAIMHDNNIIKELGNVPDILIDEKEIRQLICNLVRNGLEAMPTGGNLTISTFLVGGEVVLSVQDQGGGIVPEAMDKLGTPFFTTKDTGTGLGLAVCYSIAYRHGASIKIKTDSGGTTFQVRFKLLERLNRVSCIPGSSRVAQSRQLVKRNRISNP